MRIQTTRQQRDVRIGWTLLVFAVVAILYGLTRSMELDEVDSIQFALGVKEFNLFKHQPHPPGYPGYLSLAWLGTKCGLSVTEALVWIACIGGALFVAAWFHLLAGRFGGGPAAWTAVLLAIAPMSWMTATKALTDAPAAAAFALQLIWIFRYVDRGKARDLVVGGALGGLTAGLRPQYFPVVLLLTIGGFFCQGTRERRWRVGLAAGAAFVVATLLWLVPTLWTQAHLPEADAGWLTYPQRLVAQWRWRLDKPDVYLGAGDWSALYVVKRVWRHTFKLWFFLGLGWEPTHWKHTLGLGMFALGWVFYAWRRPWRQAGQRTFWRVHLWWAPAYFVLIFVTLPPDVRYDLPLLPLLLAPAVLGWWALSQRARWAVAAMTILLLLSTWPIAMENHREAAPPIRMIRYLRSIHTPEERGRVWLFLWSSMRQGEFYAPRFHLRSLYAPDVGTAEEAFAQSTAVYTESKDLAQREGWHGVRLVRVGKWKRSPIIHSKHAKCKLWRVEPGDDAVQESRK